MAGSTIAKIIKGNVSAVQDHLRAVERAREIYLAGIKRLEAEYFERIKNAGALLTEESEPEQQQAAAAPESETQVQPAN